MSVEATKELVKDVEGWLTDAEGIELFNLAQSCSGSGVIVEIGSWHGKSSIWLAKGSEAGNKVPVYCVDTHTGSSEHREYYGEVWTYDAFMKNITRAGVSDLITPVVQDSVEAGRIFAHPIELLFIDAGHEYEAVRADFEAWLPHVVDGGTIVFDDTSEWDGPRRLVNEEVFRSDRFRCTRYTNSLVITKKATSISSLDRVQNRCSQLKNASAALRHKLFVSGCRLFGVDA